jgi:hypothetical protein
VSASKHGLFTAGFMHCDRCISNAKCNRFVPGNQCVLEQETFDRIVSEITDEYDLDDVADKIYIERGAMYLIRIMRAEAYEAAVGMNEKTVYWDTYIGRLDNMLRGLFSDLAINRAKRLKNDQVNGMLVDLDNVMHKLTREKKKSSQILNPALKMRRLSVRKELLAMWEKDYAKFKSALKGRNKVE